MRYFCLLALSIAVPLAITASDFPEPYNTEPGDPSPMPAEEAARTASLPPGFRLELFASEPMVQQPIAICFDDVDRLWVAECYTYAERPLRWDLELNDRVTVLEDSDGDGKADRRTIFWDEGKRLTSVAVGHGGVWVLCAPHLLFIPDADQDLVPDGEPEIVLEGFDAESIGHNIVNGLKWGPDGWLYGRHGITATSSVGTPETPRSDRVDLNCSIWRFHPETREFEVFCHGGTNPWGLDWNADGQLFYTNTVIGHFWHAIPGGHYTRMFGAHLNPHVYELIPHTADHYHWDKGSEKWSDIRGGITDRTSALGGGHAHMGCLIYGAGAWPKEYEGRMFTCNLHGRRINTDILEREGCGYVARHGEDFLLMEDPWFRGLDLVTGPEGHVWVNDWSDTGECHDNDGVHRTSGRIYRIVYEGADAGKPKAKYPEWLTDRAKGRTISPEEDSDNEARQAMAVRWLAEDRPTDPETAKTLLRLAKNTKFPLVRLELAAALQRLPVESRFAIADALMTVGEDAEDRQQSLMIWYGLADAVPEDPGKAVGRALRSNQPRVTKLITRRLVEMIETEPLQVAALFEVGSGMGPERVGAILEGATAALEGWSGAPQPESWESFVQRVDQLGTEEMKTQARELSVLFGDGRAREELLAIASDAEADAGARRAALRNLLRQPDEDLLEKLRTWSTDKTLAEEAIRGFSLYETADLPARAINAWNRFPRLRAVAIDTLVSRPSFAIALLDAIEKGRIPRDAVSPSQARQIHLLGEEGIRQRLREVWGEIRETPEENRKELERWKSLLTPEVLAAGDPAKGKVVYQQACSACHKLFGEGGALGPDLTGSDRHNLDYLLGNIVNPNDVVPADYRMTVFTLEDGRVVSGVIPEEAERTITVQNAAETATVSREEIANREAIPVSLMPEGLLRSIDEESVKDLLAYLMKK